jgi:hypothetical protein
LKSSARRLDKLQSSLTPKQAFLLWMSEAHQYRCLEDYINALRQGPESAWPLARLPEQVAKATEKAMKGMPKEDVANAVREAVRDVVFLFHLHQGVNRHFREEQRMLSLQLLLLATELDGLLKDRAMSSSMTVALGQFSRELPYPLAPETGAAVESAIQRHVIIWEQFEEGGYIEEWVKKTYVEEGKRELPFWSYSMDRRELLPYLDIPTEDKVRTLFEDSDAYEKFRSGEDYSYGLSDVGDEEFEVRCNAVEASVVEEGKVVRLETVPNTFLQDVPLVEGEWIDRHVVELAEWGARMKEMGFQLQWAEDDHPLAWDVFVSDADHDRDTADASEAEARVKVQVKKCLGRFRGRIRD